MSLQGSQRRDQRRRLLVSWNRSQTASSDSATLPPRTLADYAPEALPERQPAIATLLPTGLGGFSLVALNELVNDIYGVSIKSIPSADLDLHGGEISTKDYETLWTSRSCSDWVILAKKYGFGLIVVPPQILLQLQRYDDDPAWNKYVPSCQP